MPFSSRSGFAPAMPGAEPISVSVIIPTLNEAGSIGTTLAALAAQRYPGVWEVIVVDGGSEDATRQIAAGFEGVQVLVAEAADTGGQRNLGVSAARHALLVFLDADTLPAPDFLASVAGHYARAPFAVACPWFIPATRHPGIKLIYLIFNCLFWLSQWRFHTGAGVSIVTPRSVFEATGGFPMGCRVGEDVAYLQAAARRGPHRHLPIGLMTSARRFERQGILRTLWLYLCISPHLLAGRFAALQSVRYEAVREAAE